MTHETTVPREVVARLAQNIHELHELRRQQHATMAQMIRECLAKIDEEHRSRFGFREDREARTKLNHEKAMARLHLEWLATQLENESGSIDLAPPTVTIVSQ